ncbi:MAG: hypothetical protein Q8M15_12435 [Bacteroidota bacterium]|nr:hypothetical protein [Bacteroidota bacterium]
MYKNLFVKAGICVILFCLGFGCKSKSDKSDANSVVIKGHTDFKKGTKLFLFGYTDSTDLFLDNLSAIDTSLVDENGDYYFSLKRSLNTVCELQTKDSVLVPILYLSPGKEHSINFSSESDNPGFNTSAIEGKYNDYFMKLIDTFYKEPEAKQFYYISSNFLESRQFDDYITERREKQLAFFENYFKDVIVDSNFKNFALSQIHYQFGTDKMYWVIKKRMKGVKLKIDSSYYNFLSPSLIQNQKAISCPGYIRFVKFYLKDTYERRVEKELENKLPVTLPAREKYNIAVHDFKGPALKAALYNIIYDDMGGIGNSEIYKNISLQSFDKLLLLFKQKYSIKE